MSQVLDLQKFDVLDLSKDGGQVYTVLEVELGWKQKSQFEGGAEIDIDSCALLLIKDTQGNDKIENVMKDLVYPGAQGGSMEEHYSGAMKHMGDNTEGGDGINPDEKIKIRLQEIPAKYHKVMILLNIHDAAATGQKMGMLEKAFARLVDPLENKPVVNINLDNDPAIAQATALHFATLTRKEDNSGWTVKNENRGFPGGLNDFFRKYGVEVKNG